MSAATFLIPPELLNGAQVGSQVRLPDSVAHHLAVTRISPTEEFDLVDGRGTRVTGILAGSGTVGVRSVTVESPSQLQVTVAQALIKGDRLERALEMMTEVGAAAFIPWAADHSVVKWTSEKAHRNREKWLTTIRAATEQSRRSYVPQVDPLMNSADLFTRFSEFDHVIVLEEYGGQNPSERERINRGSVLVIVGPEGGLSSSERSLFSSGTNSVSLTLGTGVLRSATAGVVAISHLFTRSGEWDIRSRLTVEG